MLHVWVLNNGNWQYLGLHPAGTDFVADPNDVFQTLLTQRDRGLGQFYLLRAS